MMNPHFPAITLPYIGVSHNYPSLLRILSDKYKYCLKKGTSQYIPKLIVKNLMFPMEIATTWGANPSFSGTSQPSPSFVPSLTNCPIMAERPFSSWLILKIIDIVVIINYSFLKLHTHQLYPNYGFKTPLSSSFDLVHQ